MEFSEEVSGGDFSFYLSPDHTSLMERVLGRQVTPEQLNKFFV
jgi:hypothetical protein